MKINEPLYVSSQFKQHSINIISMMPAGSQTTYIASVSLVAKDRWFRYKYPCIKTVQLAKNLRCRTYKSKHYHKTELTKRNISYENISNASQHVISPHVFIKLRYIGL